MNLLELAAAQAKVSAALGNDASNTGDPDFALLGDVDHPVSSTECTIIWPLITDVPDNIIII